MKTTLFKQFIEKNSIEWKYIKSEDDVVIFIPFENLKELTSMLSYSHISETIHCVMKEDCIAVMCNSLIVYYGVDIEDVFEIEK